MFTQIPSSIKVIVLGAIITLALAVTTSVHAESRIHASKDTVEKSADDNALHEEVAWMNDNFYLELHLSNTEKSKDSHGRSRSLIIQESFATYSDRSYGMHSMPVREEHFTLSEEKLVKLLQYIIGHKINRDLKETKKDAGLGTSIRVSTTIQIGNTTTKAIVSGAYSDWSSVRQNKPPSNLENLGYYSDIESLLMFMRNNLEFTFIKP